MELVLLFAFAINSDSERIFIDLIETPIDNRSAHSGKYGALIEAAFRGTQKDIEKIAAVLSCEPKEVNSLIFEIYIRPNWGQANSVLRMVEEFPSCKAALYFSGKWDHRTIGSQTGYPYITNVPYSPKFHQKEDEGPWWASINPYESGLNWDDIDYVIEKNGAWLQMTTTLQENGVAYQFIEDGAKIIGVETGTKEITIPQNIKGEPIIRVDSEVFKDGNISIYAPYMSIVDWPDLGSKKFLALGYATNLQAGAFFDENVIQKNNRYIKTQRKKLYELAVKEPILLEFMLEQKIVPLEELDLILEKANACQNIIASAMILDYKNKKFTKEEIDDLLEAKIKREIEYDPFSPQELKKNWKTQANKDGTLQIISYNGSLTNVVVPSQIGGANVSSIGEYTFSPEQKGLSKEKKENRQNIKSICLPDSIKMVEKGAFLGCRSLESIVFSKNVKTIKAETFKLCENLISFQAEDSLRVIENEAFLGCKALEKIELPKTIESLGRSVFEGCEALTIIDIGTAVTELKDSAFKDCLSLKEIVWGNQLQVIEDNCFKNCKSLEQISLPTTLTILGRYAFENCEQLKKCSFLSDIIEIKDMTFCNCFALQEVFLSESIEKIGRKAFFNCKSLKKIILPHAITKIGDMAFLGCEQLCNMVLPNKNVQIGWDAVPSHTELT